MIPGDRFDKCLTLSWLRPRSPPAHQWQVLGLNPIVHLFSRLRSTVFHRLPVPPDLYSNTPLNKWYLTSDFVTLVPKHLVPVVTRLLSKLIISVSNKKVVTLLKPPLQPRCNLNAAGSGSGCRR